MRKSAAPSGHPVRVRRQIIFGAVSLLAFGITLRAQSPAEFEMLKGQLAAAKSELAKQRAENEQLRQEKSDLEAKATQEKNAQRDLTDAKTEIKDLSAQLNAARAHNQSLTHSAESAIELQAELDQANAKLADNAANSGNAAQLASANEALRRENKELSARLNAMTALLATLREDNARLVEGKTLPPPPAAEGARPTEVFASDGYAPAAMTASGTAMKPRHAPETQVVPVATTPSSPVSPAMIESRPAETGRVHIVTAGETLARISVDFYGSADRWQTIYRANADVLGRQMALHVGQPLRIP